jgi:hypothetical protein
MGIRETVALGLLVVTFAAGLFLGAKWQKANGSSREVAFMADQLQKVRDEQAEDRKRAEKLQKTLDRLPKSEGKQRDVVRANPAKCDRPAPVADGLQDAVREANRSRALPVDP